MKKLLTLLLIVLILLLSSCTNQDKKIKQLEETIASLKEEIYPIHFIKTTKGDETLVNLIFFDQNNERLNKKAYKVQLSKGNEIFFEIKTIRVGEKEHLFFPCTIFNDVTPQEDGVTLYDYYMDKDGNQIIYNISDSTMSNMINDYYHKFKMNESVQSKNISGYGVHDLSGISTFKDNREYVVVCHPHTGAIEIREAK